MIIMTSVPLSHVASVSFSFSFSTCGACLPVSSGPSLISLMVYVDVKHHAYLLTYNQLDVLKETPHFLRSLLSVG